MLCKQACTACTHAVLARAASNPEQNRPCKSNNLTGSSCGIRGQSKTQQANQELTACRAVPTSTPSFPGILTAIIIGTESPYRASQGSLPPSIIHSMKGPTNALRLRPHPAGCVAGGRLRRVAVAIDGQLIPQSQASGFSRRAQCLSKRAVCCLADEQGE